MKKILTTLICAFVAVAGPLSARSTITIQAPNLVSGGEQFNITFVIEGEDAPAEFEWEPGGDFQLVWGPQKGSSTSISIVNGKKTRSSQTTYTYVLIPRKAGVFQLPAAVATVKGQKLTSASHRIEVVAEDKAQGRSQGSSAAGGKQDPAVTGTVDGRDLFLKLIPSKTRVFVGEALTLTIKLYSRVNVAGFEDVKFPSFNGFWSQELQAPTNIQFQREKVGESIYDAALFRSYTLIPQQSGDVVIDPVEMVCQIMVRAPRASQGSIFDSFFQDDYRTIRKRVSTDPLTVRVSPLPAGAPSSFGGGVGEFRMSASLTRDSLRTHDAASLRVTVSGRGNVSMLDAPRVNFPPDFEVYDVKMSESTDKAHGRLSGSKTFEFPFIPRSHGDFELPPVEYSYFDPSSGRYVTLRSQPLEIKVARGSEAEGAVAEASSAPGVIRKDVRDLGSDIRFIVSKAPSLKPGKAFFVFSPLFNCIALLLLLIAAGAYVTARRIASRRADVVGTRGRAATKMARRRLSKAAGYLEGNLYSAFYEELHKALLGFISDKFNLDAFDLSKETVSERLASAGVGEGLGKDFVSLLEACEFARYSSSEGNEAMKDHYEKAVAVITGIDAAMRRPSGKGKAAAAVLLALCLVPAANAAQLPPRDSLWNAGTAAYADGRWEEALGDWMQIASDGVESPQLYYNIGNAFFKADDKTRAILWYERALKLDPSYGDARFNLEFANSFVQDRIDVVPEFFLKAWARSFRYLLPSDVWAVLALVFFAGFLGMLLLFLLSGVPSARKAGFFTALAALILAVCCLASASRQRSDALKEDSAIVTRAVSTVRSAPGADVSKDLFVLHEGTKVKILDSAGDWKNIEISDGRRGWMRSNDLEII